MAPDPKRLELQLVFEGMVGVKKAYFQPTSDIKLQYPCVVYNLDDVKTQFADNRPYRRDKRYQVTVIDRDPDTDIPDQIGVLPKCSFERSMVVDNLHHFIFNLYF